MIDLLEGILSEFASRSRPVAFGDCIEAGLSIWRQHSKTSIALYQLRRDPEKHKAMKRVCAKAWRARNPEKHRVYNREWQKRKRAMQCV